eukprot:762639-Hanusia_phi.AAC.13
MSIRLTSGQEDKGTNPIIVAAANAIADKVTTTLAASSSNEIKTVEDEENLSVTSVMQRKEIMCKLANRPSRVIKAAFFASSLMHNQIVLLRNMVEPEDVDPMVLHASFCSLLITFEQLEQEIAEECSKFGKVVKVLIVTMVEQGARLVKVFVEFGDQEAASKAVARLDKRWFGGKVRRARGQLYGDSKLAVHEQHQVYLCGAFATPCAPQSSRRWRRCCMEEMRLRLVGVEADLNDSVVLLAPHEKLYGAPPRSVSSRQALKLCWTQSELAIVELDA